MRPSLTQEESMTDEQAFLAGAPLPSTAKPFTHYTVVQCQPHRPLSVWMLADLPWGVYQHHLERSILCKRPAPCDLCNQQLARRYVGYAPAALRDSLKPVVVKFTHGAAAQLQRYRNQYGTVCNRLLRMERVRNAANAAVKVECLTVQNPPANLPMYFDVRPTVLYLHGYAVEDIIRLGDLASAFTGMTTTE